MKFLRTIDPLTQMKGKLNFMKFENQPILNIYKLANSLSINQNVSKTSTLQSVSVQQINSLSTPQNDLIKQGKKLKFQVGVFKNADVGSNIGTIFQQPSVSQKKLIKSLLQFSDKLNVKQNQYLQYSLRRRINGMFPSWANLHFNKQSPLSKQFNLIPKLSDISRLNDLKLVSKKQLIPIISQGRPVKQEQIAQPQPVAQQKGKKKGK